MREPSWGPERADLELDRQERKDRRYVLIAKDWITVGLAAVGLGTAVATLWRYALG